MTTLSKISIFLLVVSACHPTDTELIGSDVKTIDLPGFTVTAPALWTSFEFPGGNSGTGGLTNHMDTLAYNLGHFPDDLHNETETDYDRTNATIDGHDALIVTPKKNGVGVTGVYINYSEFVKLGINGTDLKDATTAMNIFYSVRFK